MFELNAKKRIWVENDKVNVEAFHVTYKGKGDIPVPLGLIVGNFICRGCFMTSLLNAPHTVTGVFDCSKNQITSLALAPKQVSTQTMVQLFNCSKNWLQSFEGAPEEFTGPFDGRDQAGLKSYDGIPPQARLVDVSTSSYSTVPMLKLIQFKKVRVFLNERGPLIQDITDIIAKYAGQGKSGALRCAADMIQAGYKEKARW